METRATAVAEPIETLQRLAQPRVPQRVPPQEQNPVSGTERHVRVSKRTRQAGAPVASDGRVLANRLPGGGVHQSSRPREIFADDDDPRSVRVERRAATPLERVQRPRAHVRRVPEVCFLRAAAQDERLGTRERRRAKRTRIAVGVLRVVTLEQIAVGDVVEKKFAHVRTDERAIAVRAHERDAREHRTVARGRPPERADGSKSTVDEMSIASVSAGTAARVSRTFAAREAIRQVSGCVQEVPGLGTRMWFEKRRARTPRWAPRTGGVARGGTSS